MKIRTLLLSATGASIIATSLALTGPATADEQSSMKLSEEGSKAIHAMSLARVAIFEGQPQEAEKLVEQAKMALAAAARDADKWQRKPQTADAGAMIPVDARLTLADDLVLTPEKKARIEKINEHLKKGEHKQAIEALRADKIYVTLSTALLPLDGATKTVDDAAKLLGEGKYYEANLALKKAEDSVVVDSQNFVEYLDALPKHDKQGKD